MMNVRPILAVALTVALACKSPSTTARRGAASDSALPRTSAPPTAMLPAPVGSLHPGDAPANESSFGSPSSAPVMTFRDSEDVSRRRASQDGLHLVSAQVVDRGRAGIHTYGGKDDEGNARRQVHLIAEKMDPWILDGYEGTEVAGPLPGVPASVGKLYFVTVTGCPGGFCPGGCGGGMVEGTLRWRNGKWDEVPVLRGARLEDYADHDGDGELELRMTIASVDMGSCGGRWCCWVLGRFSQPGLVGWDGERWTPELPRFRGHYERMRAEKRAALRGGAGDAGAQRCTRLEEAVASFFLTRMLDGDAASAKTAFESDAQGLTHRDCVPADNQNPQYADGEWSWDEFREVLYAVDLPSIPPAGDAGR